MRMLLRGGQVWEQDAFVPMDLLVEDGKVTGRGTGLSDAGCDRVFELDGLAVFPGFADVHVHLREPGFSYKETIASGSRAAAHGGYTCVCAMPNLSPAPDDDGHLRQEEELIARDAVIRVLPYASITKGQKGEGELVDFEALAGRVCGFSDDGRGVKTSETMREAMRRCAAADSIIAAHCEDLRLIPQGGVIHAGRYAEEHGIPGIPSSSEWEPIARDVQLCAETGCRYHVCHVSCHESLEVIRRAKRCGVDITCETGPHYLLLTEGDLRDEGRFKMNPPLRGKDDRRALLDALRDGTVDIIATDHAPHSAEEKARGLRGSAMGIVGIETCFPLLYTYLVETGELPLGRLIHCLTEAPRQRFRLGGGLRLGDHAELTVFDLHTDEVIDPDTFLSQGRATPFEGWRVHAACRLTVCGDTVAYDGME